MKSISLLSALFFFCLNVQSQNIGVKTAAPNNSAILDLTTPQVAGSEKGFLMTRMDSTQREDMPPPIANALWVYQNKNDSGFYSYDVNKWRRAHQTYGTVQMDNLSSGVLNGAHTFTVDHLAPGIDDINYRDFVGYDGAPANRPIVVVSGEITEAPLSLHNNAFNYCVNDQNFCSDLFINTVTINNGGPNLIQNVASGCSPSTYYSHTLIDNSIADCVASGSTLNIFIQLAGTYAGPERVQVWIDWDGDGFFSIAETVGATQNATPGVQNYPVVVPAGTAQATFTAVRIMTRSYNANTNIEGCVTSGSGTSRAEVEDYYIPLCSTSGTYPMLTPFCSTNEVNNAGFRVYCQDLDGEPVNVKYHFKVHEK